MMKWEIAPLGSMVKFLSGGTPNKSESKYWSGDIPWVSSGEMSEKRIYQTSLAISDDAVDEASVFAPKGTIFLVVRGMSLAKEFRVSIAMRPMCFNQDVKAILPTPNINNWFLFYYLQSQNNAIRDSASEAAHGTKKLDMPVLEQWPLPLPPLPIQKKIAAILSAHDDLIENNKRRIAILEKMAEELYREWFVRLRFPGHERVKITKGVPEGWEVKRIGEVVMATPPVKLSKGDIVANIDMDAVDSSRKFAFGKNECKGFTGGSKFQGGDTIFARITPCLQNGKIAKIDPHIHTGFGSTEFFVLRNIINLSTSNWVYYQLHSSLIRDTAIASMTGASGRQRADLFSIISIPVLLPPYKLLNHFEEIIGEIDSFIIICSNQNNNLSIIRDRLLSRLMSGKIDVEDLDIKFPPSMEEEEAVHA